VKILGAAEPPQPLTPKSWAMPGNYYQEWEKSLEDQARAAVEKAAVQLAGMALTVLPEVIKGQARDVILNAAENWGADLIVLGSRGLGGFERLLLGSVSHAVVTHAHCSVKIVRERQTTD
jgi:nucleotide-binding universal stress UspA family protein